MLETPAWARTRAMLLFVTHHAWATWRLPLLEESRSEIGDEAAGVLGHAEDAFAADDGLHLFAHECQQRGAMAAVSRWIRDAVYQPRAHVAQHRLGRREHKRIGADASLGLREDLPDQPEVVEMEAAPTGAAGV